MKNCFLVVLFFTLNSLLVNGQEKINIGKYLYEEEKFFDIITIENDSIFTYLEYYKPLEKLIDKKDKSEIPNFIKHSKAKVVITGKGRYKFENKTLSLKFYKYDTHRNQINFDYNRNLLNYKLQDLEKL
jgi:hypothetical protein